MNRLRNILAGGCLALALGAGLARAQTVVWSDNFDTNGAARWSASAGVWRVTTAKSHSGSYAASTAGYSNAAHDSRFVCTSYNGASSLVVPAANQYPRLRFWQWYNYSDALGYVEISTNAGNNWTPISPTYENTTYPTGGGVWSRPYFDLSAYGSQNIWVAFHFTSGIAYGNGMGWFVDDVEVDTGTPQENFPEGFEFDPKMSDWSADAGTWEIGHPTSGPGAAHSGTNCAATVLAGNYANNVDSRLISPPFTVPASNSPALRLWQWYSLNNALAYVEINNGGITSVTVTNTTITTNSTAVTDTNVYQLSGALNTFYSTPLYWNQTIGAWTNTTRALGLVNDYVSSGLYFETGIAPFEPTNYGAFYVEYRLAAAISPPLPGAGNVTNYLDLQGATWESVSDSSDQPVGAFGTTNIETYTTNTTTSTSENSWTQLSPTYEDATSGGWTNAGVDLSTYAGQTVRIAFHFTSGGVYSAPGWYVDDLTLSATPELIVPTNQVVYDGDELDMAVYATNTVLPNATYKYRLM